MKIRTFFFSYVGGKSKDLKKIMPSVDLNNIKTIVEPFCGSCAFSSHLESKCKFYFNDIDEDLMKFLNDVKNGEFPKMLKKFNAEFKEYINKDKPSEKWKEVKKDISKNYFLCRRLGKRGGMLDLKQKEEKIGCYRHLISLFKKAELHNDDYRVTLEKFKNDPTAFIFLDPPYFDSFNSSYTSYKGNSAGGKTQIIDNTHMYIDFIDYLNTAKCKVMLIINSNAITNYLYKGHIKTTYAKRYDLTGRCCEHLIVTNY